MKNIYIFAAGEPGSGKSTFLEALLAALQQSGVICEIKYLPAREKRNPQFSDDCILIEETPSTK
jgi:uridine kinase